MKNTGKKFEDLLKLSCKEQRIDYTRLKDAGGWGKSENTRFTIKNICDCILFYIDTILFVEQKSRKNSMRFDELTQYKDLKNKTLLTFKNKYVILIIEFKKDNKVYCLDINQFEGMQKTINKKSFNSKDCKLYGCIEIKKFIPNKKRKARLNIKKLIKDLKNENKKGRF